MRRDFLLAAMFIYVVPAVLAGQNQTAPSDQTQPTARQQAPDSPVLTSTSPETSSPEMVGDDVFTNAAKRPRMGQKDFENLALGNNPTLEQARNLVQRSAARARQAGLYPNPAVGYEGDEIRGGSFGGGEQGGFVQQTIVLGGKLGLRKRVYQEQQRENEIGFTEQRVGLIGDVDQRFYAALSAQEIVNVREQLLTLAHDIVQTAHQLGNVGQADLPDVLQADVEAEQAEVDEVTARMNYVQAFDALAATVGKPSLDLCLLEGDLESLPVIDPQIVETIERDSPSVKGAQQSLAEAEAQLRSARREAIPDLHLRAGLQRDFEILNEAAVRPTSVGVVGFASASMDLPLFNRNQGNVAAASAELARAREEVTRVQLALRRAVDPIYHNYLAETHEANLYRTIMIPKASRAYQLYRENYNRMAAAYPQVLISQRTLFQLQVGYVLALERLWQNAIALKSFVLTDGLGAPFEGGTGLKVVNAPSSPGLPGE